MRRVLVFLVAVIILLAATPTSVSAHGNHFRYDPVRTYRTTTSNSCGSHGNQYRNRSYNHRSNANLNIQVGGKYHKTTVTPDGQSKKTIRISVQVGLSFRK